MNSVFYALIACAWAGLAAINLYEKRYVSGILQTGIAILDLIIVYLCSK
jgi:hypothetical protein